jgi:hypothetical protein
MRTRPRPGYLTFIFSSAFLGAWIAKTPVGIKLKNKPYLNHIKRKILATGRKALWKG